MSRKIAIFSGCRFFQKIGHREKSAKIGKHWQTSANIGKKSGKIGKNRQIGEKIGKQILTLLKYKICIVLMLAVVCRFLLIFSSMLPRRCFLNPHQFFLLMLIFSTIHPLAITKLPVTVISGSQINLRIAKVKMHPLLPCVVSTQGAS